MIVEPGRRALETPQHIPRHAARSREPKSWLFLGVAVAEIAGAAAVVKSALISQTTVSNEAEFIWFWLGMIVAELPLIAMLACRATSAAARSALLIVLGFVSYLPKLLRDPSGPIYHDEYVHWRDTYDVIASGRLFEPTAIIPIIARYPGLHAATAAIVEISGLSLWQAATILLLLCHVATLLGVATLARSVGFDSRAAALVAVIYGFNASYLYFDTQYAYESMAICIITWALVCFAQAVRARPGPRRRAWCVLTAMLTLGCVTTHHLSTVELAVVMMLISVVLSLPRAARADGWRGTVATAWGLTAFAIVAICGWIWFVAPGTVAYLSPYLGTGFGQLLRMAAGSGSGRQLFSASLSPWWEHIAAFAVTFVALVAAVVGFLRLRRWLRDGRLPSGKTRGLLFAYAVIGMVYFPSTAFIFSPAGAEGARRSWAISWIGLAILTGPAGAWILDWAARRRRQVTRNVIRLGIATAAVISLVGGTAAGLDPSYRFNGPFLFGSDARSDTPELNAMTTWFRERFGLANRVITDRFTGLLLASYGLQDPGEPSGGFPAWDLYIYPPGKKLGPPGLIANLTISHYMYLIVDKRMATDVPHIGIYFEGNEPASVILPDGQPIFKGRLTSKFDKVFWMSKVFESDNYAVYSMDLPPEIRWYQARPARFHAKLAVGQ